MLHAEAQKHKELVAKGVFYFYYIGIYESLNLHHSVPIAIGTPLKGRNAVQNIPLRVPTLRDRGVHTIDFN